MSPSPAWQVPAHRVSEFRPKNSAYCVCIPVINEGTRFRGQLTTLKQLGITEIADVLILDGGSTDGSTAPEILTSEGVRALLVKTGPGKLSAQLRMGYAYALQQGYEGIITVDGNGKDGLDAIPRFVKALKDGVDFVQGSRYQPGGEAINTPLLRKVAIHLVHVPVLRFKSGFHYTDTTNGFRGYSRRLLLDERVQPFRDIFNTYELLAYITVRAPRLGFRVCEVPVRRSYPKTGKVPTKISPFKGNMILLATLWKVLTNQYDPPAVG